MFDPQHHIKTECGDAYGPSMGHGVEAWNSEAQGHTQLHIEFKNSLVYKRHFLKTKKERKQLWALFLFFVRVETRYYVFIQSSTQTFLDHFIQSCSMSTSLLGTSGWPHILFFLICFHTFFLDHITYDTNYQLYLYMNFKVHHLIISVWALSVTCKKIYAPDMEVPSCSTSIYLLFLQK